MKLESVRIKNFRGIVDATIAIADVTTFVGRNDVGKSSVLAAFDAFFNRTKLDEDDFNRQIRAISQETAVVEIDCVFDGPWAPITLDESEITSFKQEGLLRGDGKLELRKTYAIGRSAKFKSVCSLVSDPNCGKLFASDHDALIRIFDKLHCTCGNRSSNVQLRAAIRQRIMKGKDRKDIECELTNSRLEGVLKVLPCFMFFASDRENMPGDNVVMSPMRAAVRSAFQSKRVLGYIEKVEKAVRAELMNVVESTRNVLEGFNSEIADTMLPDFPSVEVQKWCDVFKQFTLRSRAGIPLENRGSGVRRMVLLSFLCAEARRKVQKDRRNIIYAIEEPETAQHSDNQIRVAKALQQLAKRDDVQVVLTTHSGHMLKQLADTRMQIVDQTDGQTHVLPVELTGKHELYINPLSLVELSYLLLGDCVPEYHSELYGYLEKKGLNLESWCEKMLKRKGSAQYQRLYSRNMDGSGESMHSYPMYIRDRLHHPENANYDQPTEAEVRSSIEMMREFMRGDGKKQLMCKPVKNFASLKGGR